jgi:hypothetical protein
MNTHTAGVHVGYLQETLEHSTKTTRYSRLSIYTLGEKKKQNFKKNQIKPYNVKKNLIKKKEL